jgi:hypothetical protein
MRGGFARRRNDLKRVKNRASAGIMGRRVRDLVSSSSMKTSNFALDPSAQK